jgi:spermidine/putrescine transport system substrate-binding protein
MRRILLALLAFAGCSKPQPELYVFNWADYFADDTIAAFEKEFGCKVKVDDITSAEALRAKLQLVPSGYDVVFVNDELMPAAVAGGWLEKLDLAKLPNLKNIAPKFRNLGFDPKNEHSVPYMWGTTGIAYNKEKLSPAPESWTALWDAKLANRVTMLGDPREVFAAAMWAEGLSPLQPTLETVEKAAKKLMERKPLAYNSAPKEMLGSGDAWLSQCFNGDAVQAADKAPIGYVIPKEGGTLWLDNLCVAKGARNPDLAHKFIDYILRPEVSAAISNKVFYANPNAEAEKLISKEVRENPFVYPPEADLKRCAFLSDPPPDVKKKLQDLWAKVRGQ